MAGNITDQWFAAASVGEDYKTMHVWDGDGNAARVFELNFQGGYINQADVKSFMVNKTTQERTNLTVKFTGTNTVTLSQAVPTTHQVTIYRDTNKTSPLASFADGAIITAINLDRNAKQAVFAVAEMVDRFDSVTATAQDAIATAYTALANANTAIQTANGAVSTANAASSAAAGAVSDAKAAVQTANSATQTANSAKQTAEGIDAKVNQAVSTASAANSTANAANATANGIDAKATQAQSDAAKAKTDAAAALNTVTGIDAKATEALEKANTANTNATTALNAVNASAGNFDKIWATVQSINASDNYVTWKGRHQFPSVELSSDSPYIDFHYGSSTADYTHRLIADNANRLYISSGLGINGNLESKGSSTITGDSQFKQKLSVLGRLSGNEIVEGRGFYVFDRNSAIAGRQGTHILWNETNGQGESAFVNNRGGGTGGFVFRVVDSGNTTETGSIRISGTGDLTASGNVNGGAVISRGSVYAGNSVSNGQLAPDGNVYGTRWGGGWAFDWITSNCMTDFGRGGQQYRGSARDAWEAPAGCVVTGRNNNVGDGRDQGIYFRQLIGRKINGGQFGVGDFG